MLFEALRNTCHICTLWILVFVSCVVFVFVSFSKTWPEHHQSYASLLLSQSSARCESFFVCFCILYLCAFVFCICVYLYFVFVSPEEYQVSIINPMPLSFYLSHLHAVNLFLCVFVFCICVHLYFVFVCICILYLFHLRNTKSVSSILCLSPSISVICTLWISIWTRLQFCLTKIINTWHGRVTFWTFQDFEDFKHLNSTAWKDHQYSTM